MSDYIFFQKKPYQAFLQFLVDQRISFEHEQLYQQAIAKLSYMVKIDPVLDPELLDKAEKFYDQMLELDVQVADNIENQQALATGIRINLSSGTQTTAEIDPLVLEKISHCLSYEELMSVVNAIVDAVESPRYEP